MGKRHPDGLFAVTRDDSHFDSEFFQITQNPNDSTEDLPFLCRLELKFGYQVNGCPIERSACLWILLGQHAGGFINGFQYVKIRERGAIYPTAIEKSLHPSPHGIKINVELHQGPIIIENHSLHCHIPTQREFSREIRPISM